MRSEGLRAWHWLVFAVLLCGCDASAVQLNARAAEATGLTLDGLSTLIVDARTESLQRVEEETQGQFTEDRLRAIYAERALWEVPVRAYNAAVRAWDAWVGAIGLAHAAGGGEAVERRLYALAAHVVLLYDEIASALQAAGADAPSLPDFVRVLVEGFAGGES